MTDEELERLMQEVSGQIGQLSEVPGKPLTKEKKRKMVLQLQMETLKRIRAAKERGDWQQEIKDSLDYIRITEIEEKRLLLKYIIEVQMGRGF